MASSTGTFLSRGDHKKAKELEEARKAGTLPAELDEEGREINPHIPDFMARAPWYLNQAAPGLKHQKNSRVSEQTGGLDAWYVRGLQKGPAATKFRKGACPNCGAITHTLQDCLERPRAKGAQWTQQQIRPDELPAQDLALSYDGKRDRFAGFDLGSYQQMVGAKFEAEEAARRLHVQAQAQARLSGSGTAEAHADGEGGAAAGGAADGRGDAEDVGGLRVREEEDVVAQREGGGTRQGAPRMSVRNLRIREDTAKYLLNLDPNSAHYDPKTRAMRENPRPDAPLPGAEDAGVGGAFVGDNFVRHRGETLEMLELQTFTAAAFDKGQELHINAEPTQVELANRVYRQRKQALQSSRHNSVLAKYGGEAHLAAVDPRLLLAQSEAYLEYDAAGRVRGQDAAEAAKAAVRSRYAEDVRHANHTAVWGSHFDRAACRWGYADDQSTVRHSYSTGEAGRRARELAAASVAAGMDGPSRAQLLSEQQQQQQQAQQQQVQQPEPDAAAAAAAAAARAARAAAAPTKALYGIGEALGAQPLDAQRLQGALQRERARSQTEAKGGGGTGKRGYNSMAEDSVTAEDMEAYYLSKRRADDPLAHAGGDAVADE